jgi:hypothetical protein
VGFQEEEVERILHVYGEGKQPYAAAVALITTLIGHDALFDTDPSHLLVFPHAALKKVKRADPDVVDHLAFEHINSYRELFVSSVQHAMHIRCLESLERDALLRDITESCRRVQYRSIVSSQALQYIEPIESERRGSIAHDENIVYEGLLSWFRHRRYQLLSGVGLTSVQSANEQGKASLAECSDTPLNEKKLNRFKKARQVEAEMKRQKWLEAKEPSPTSRSTRTPSDEMPFSPAKHDHVWIPGGASPPHKRRSISPQQRRPARSTSRASQTQDARKPQRAVYAHPLSSPWAKKISARGVFSDLILGVNRGNRNPPVT